MKKLIVFPFLLVLIIHLQAQQYHIKGRITGYENGTKVYLWDLDEQHNVDSALFLNNAFSMKGRLDNTPRSFWLRVKTDDINEPNTCHMLIGNENVTVTGDRKDFPHYMTIRGSKIQDAYNIVNHKTRAFYKRRDSLVWRYLKLEREKQQPEEQEKIWKVVNKIDDTTEAIRKEFIQTHSNSYAGLKELFFLKKDFDTQTIRNIYNGLTPEFRKSRDGQAIANYLAIGAILKKGDQFSDFEAIDQYGKKHRLSEIKGKYILLDFMTTYCDPCMKSVDELRRISEKYADKLSVISFNADGGKQTWMKGVTRDKPTWQSWWDGKGAYGNVIQKYGVTGYPTFILIDPSGKIIHETSGYGPGKLEQIMAKEINAKE